MTDVSTSTDTAVGDSDTRPAAERTDAPAATVPPEQEYAAAREAGVPAYVLDAATVRRAPRWRAPSSRSSAGWTCSRPTRASTPRPGSRT